MHCLDSCYIIFVLLNFVLQKLRCACSKDFKVSIIVIAEHIW